MSLFNGRKILGAGAAIIPSPPATPQPDPVAIAIAQAEAAHAAAADAAVAQAAAAAKKHGEKKDPADDKTVDDDDKDEEGDDDTDTEEMRRGSASQACRARRRERARIAAILGHASAATNPQFAAHLALSTDLGRDTAVGLLEKAPPAATGRDLGTRMGPVAGIAAAPNAPQQTAAQAASAGWDDAFARHAVTGRK